MNSAAKYLGEVRSIYLDEFSEKRWCFWVFLLKTALCINSFKRAGTGETQAPGQPKITISGKETSWLFVITGRWQSMCFRVLKIWIQVLAFPLTELEPPNFFFFPNFYFIGVNRFVVICLFMLCLFSFLLPTLIHIHPHKPLLIL